MLPENAVIFAGGRSSRMGKDKALLPFGNFDTMTEYQYRRLLPLFKKVYISAKTDKFPFSAPLLIDNYEISSPLAGLVSVFETLQSPELFIISVDLPLLPTELIQNLREQYSKELKNGTAPDIMAFQSPKGIEPMAAIYTEKMLKTAQEMLKENRHRLNDLLKNVSTKTLNWNSEKEFTNLNRPEDYRNAKEGLCYNNRLTRKQTKGIDEASR